MEVNLKMEEDFELVLDRHGRPISLDLTAAGLAKVAAIFGRETRPVVLVAGEDGQTITVKLPAEGPVVRRITEA